jgi:hypothetical protein
VQNIHWDCSVGVEVALDGEIIKDLSDFEVDFSVVCEIGKLDKWGGIKHSGVCQ